MSRILVVGAGFSGAVVARQLAEAGHACLVIDEREHVAGNCHTSVDPESGIMVHRYGPHIFHTDNDEVWTFVSRFCDWAPYRHAVYSTVEGRVFSLPVNLLTINQFFGKAMTPDEARTFVANVAVPTEHPANFREQGIPGLTLPVDRGHRLALGHRCVAHTRSLPLRWHSIVL